MKQNIELHIKKLVMYGFDPVNRFRIGSALETELTRLFTEMGLPSSLSHSGEFAGLDGGTFNVTPNSRAEGIGTKIAQSVYGGLNK